MDYFIVDNTHRGYFLISKRKLPRGRFKINELLKNYKIDLNNYWILKHTGNFRFLSQKDIDKYAGFFCLDKSKFKKEHIEMWLNGFYKDWKISIPYLVHPFPPVEILNKIKVVEWDMK